MFRAGYKQFPSPHACENEKQSRITFQLILHVPNISRKYGHERVFRLNGIRRRIWCVAVDKRTLRRSREYLKAVAPSLRICAFYTPHDASAFSCKLLVLRLLDPDESVHGVYPYYAQLPNLHL